LKLFIKALGCNIAHADLKGRGADLPLLQNAMQCIHKRGADPALADLGNNIQSYHMRAGEVLDARQNKSKNPAKPLGDPCYALGVMEIKTELCPGERDMRREANLIDRVEGFKILFPEAADTYWQVGHTAIILLALWSRN